MHTLAISLATLSNFLFGALWYSPFLFGSLWQKESSITAEQMKLQGFTPFIAAFFYSLASAIGFNYLVRHSLSLNNNIIIALIVGILLVAPSLGVNYQFAGRPNKVFLIDAGYHVVRFLIFAVLFWYIKH